MRRPFAFGNKLSTVPRSIHTVYFYHNSWSTASATAATSQHDAADAFSCARPHSTDTKSLTALRRYCYLSAFPSISKSVWHKPKPNVLWRWKFSLFPAHATHPAKLHLSKFSVSLCHGSADSTAHRDNDQRKRLVCSSCVCSKFIILRCSFPWMNEWMNALAHIPFIFSLFLCLSFIIDVSYICNRNIMYLFFSVPLSFLLKNHLFCLCTCVEICQTKEKALFANRINFRDGHPFTYERLGISLWFCRTELGSIG